MIKPTYGLELNGYVFIERAPVDYIRGSRTRAIEGHLVKGSWSDPWWGFNSETRMWAIIKRWKNKTYKYYWPKPGGTISARNELVITPMVLNKNGAGWLEVESGIETVAA